MKFVEFLKSNFKWGLDDDKGNQNQMSMYDLINNIY